jgi:hypothetical protein
VKLTTHLNLVPRVRKRGAIPPLPHTFLWRGVWLGTGTTLPLIPLHLPTLFNYISHILVDGMGR